MAAVETLTAAGNLLTRFGHNPADRSGGCALTGYTITGAITAAAHDEIARHGLAPTGHTRLGEWVKVRAAVSYVLAVLGYDPEQYSPSAGREQINRAADGIARRGLGTGWAVAVVDAAASLAAAAGPRAAAAVLADRTRAMHTVRRVA